MIITISGPPGSGKSSIGKMIAKRLGYKYYSIGRLRGQMALKKGMTLEEYNKLGEKDPSTDKEADKYMRNIAAKNKKNIIDSRLGFYFIPNSVKIYLDVSLEEGAKRRFKNQREDEKEYKNLQEVIKASRKRIRSDRLRYKKYYNINCFDKKHYDLVVDTTRLSKPEVLERVLGFLRTRGFKC